MEIMVEKAKRNKMNNDKQTPLDIATERESDPERGGELKDRKMQILLEKRGAQSGSRIVKQPLDEYLLAKRNWWEALVRFYYFNVKDLTLEMRNVVLVVAALITTATYAAVLQPPGGINQVSADPEHIIASSVAPPPKYPGKMVMADHYYHNFMPANTAAFTLSVVVIIFMLYGRPYNIVLHACLIFMSYSYLVALQVISQDSDHTTTTLFILSWYSISGVFAVKMLYYVVRSLYEDVWWLPGGAVGASNFFDRCRCKNTVSSLRAPRRQYKLLQSSAPKKQAAG